MLGFEFFNREIWKALLYLKTNLVLYCCASWDLYIVKESEQGMTRIDILFIWEDIHMDC